MAGSSAELESGAHWQTCSEEEADRPQLYHQRRRKICVGRRAFVGVAVAAVAALSLVALTSLASSRAPPPRRGAKDSVQLFGAVALATAAASSLASSAKLVKDAEKLEPELEGDAGSFMKPWQGLKDKLKVHPGVSKYEVNLTEMGNLSKGDLLKPEEQDRNDGNLCPDDEELHANLCYKRCSDLTGGKYPIRTTAWSCCMEEPCSFFNSKFTSLLKYCDGFDVSGNSEGKECPHAPGTCMENEEFSLGQCYKKCAILTNNTFPYRSAASTCCRFASHLACLDALNTQTKPEFDVGGGLGDDHQSTPNIAHSPLTQLTEHGVTNTPTPNKPTAPPEAANITNDTAAVSAVLAPADTPAVVATE